MVDDDDRKRRRSDWRLQGHIEAAFAIRHTSGILCTPILQEQATALPGPLVDVTMPMSTAFTVIDYKQGLTWVYQ